MNLFYSTGVTRTPQAIIEEYTGRWTIETTFEGVRATKWGWRARRSWCGTDSGAMPSQCLLGLYSNGDTPILAAAPSQDQTGTKGVAQNGQASGA